MRKGILLFAVTAFALTGGTIYFVNSWMKQEKSRMAERVKKEEPPKEAGVYVLVAAKDLPAGHLVAVADLRWQSWPDKAVPEQYVVKKVEGSTDIPQSYVGTVVRRGVTASGPITSDALIKLGDRGFLAAVLKPGTRAISIRIDESTGVSGLIYPGDRVDVILTHEVSQKGKEGEHEVENKTKVSETVLSNVRVIAIDQSLEDLKNAKNQQRAPKTVTIEVTPRQAEIVTVGLRMGTLTLTLQSLACAGDAEVASTEDTASCADTKAALPGDTERTRGFTADSDVSRLSKRAPSGSVEIHVLRGTDEKNSKTDGLNVKPTTPAAAKQK